MFTLPKIEAARDLSLWRLLSSQGFALVTRGLDMRPEAIDSVILAQFLAGIQAIEITLDTPDAYERIASWRQDPQIKAKGVAIGAGTVMTSYEARIAREAGAQFIVSPRLHKLTVKRCWEASVPVIPGCSDVDRAISSWELGASVIKIYPRQMEVWQALRELGPTRQIPLMITGWSPQTLEMFYEQTKNDPWAIPVFNTTQFSKKDDPIEIRERLQSFMESMNKLKATA